MIGAGAPGTAAGLAWVFHVEHRFSPHVSGRAYWTSHHPEHEVWHSSTVLGSGAAILSFFITSYPQATDCGPPLRPPSLSAIRRHRIRSLTQLPQALVSHLEISGALASKVTFAWPISWWAMVD